MSTEPNQMIQAPDGWADLEVRLRLLDPARALGEVNLGHRVRARQTVEGVRHRRLRPAQLRLWGGVVGIGAVVLAAVFVLLFVNRDDGVRPADPLPEWVKLSILDRPQTPADVPDRNIPISNLQHPDWTSARLLHRADDGSMYLMNDMTTPNTHCLVLYSSGSAQADNCFSLEAIALYGAWITVRGVAIVPDGIRTVTSHSGTRVRVHDNVAPLTIDDGPYRLDGPAASEMRAGLPGSAFPQTETPNTDAVTIWRHSAQTGSDVLRTGLPAPDQSFQVVAFDGTGSGQMFNLARQRQEERIQLDFPGNASVWRRQVAPPGNPYGDGLFADDLSFVVVEGVSRGSLSQWAKVHSTRGTAILLDPRGRLRAAFDVGPGPERITIGPTGVAERRIAGTVNWFADGVEPAPTVPATLADVIVGTPVRGAVQLVRRVSDAGHPWPAGCRPDPKNVTVVELPSGRTALIGTDTDGGGLLSVVDAGVVYSACTARNDAPSSARFGALIIYLARGHRSRSLTAVGRVDPRYTSVTYRGKSTPLISGVFEIDIPENFDSDFFLQFRAAGMPELRAPDGNEGLQPHTESVKLR